MSTNVRLGERHLKEHVMRSSMPLRLSCIVALAVGLPARADDPLNVAQILVTLAPGQSVTLKFHFAAADEQCVGVWDHKTGSRLKPLTYRVNHRVNFVVYEGDAEPWTYR